MSALSRKLSLFVRIAVSVGLIAFMLSRLDFENMVRFLRRADLGLVFLTLVTVFIDHIGHGGEHAAPVARAVFDAYFRLQEERRK